MHIVSIEESISELLFRLKQMDEVVPTEYHLNKMIHHALLDTRVVIDNIDEYEIEQARQDPNWNYMQDDIIHDPFEAFHFNVVEEVVGEYMQLIAGPDRLVKGFKVVGNSRIVVYY